MPRAPLHRAVLLAVLLAHQPLAARADALTDFYRGRTMPLLTGTVAACRDAKVEVDPVSGIKLQANVEQILATPVAIAQRTQKVLE